jgi:hypothetical protein
MATDWWLTIAASCTADALLYFFHNTGGHYLAGMNLGLIDKGAQALDRHLHQALGDADTRSHRGLIRWKRSWQSSNRH